MQTLTFIWCVVKNRTALELRPRDLPLPATRSGTCTWNCINRHYINKWFNANTLTTVTTYTNQKTPLLQRDRAMLCDSW